MEGSSTTEQIPNQPVQIRTYPPGTRLYLEAVVEGRRPLDVRIHKTGVKMLRVTSLIGTRRTKTLKVW
jgi:hypothetical protein